MNNPNSVSAVERGRLAERLAEEHLVNAGLQLLQRNYRYRGGEIDIILLDLDILVFVEVRFRANESFLSAAESINASKQNRITRTANHYLVSHRADAGRQCRFDVVLISGSPGTEKIQWMKNAFET